MTTSCACTRCWPPVPRCVICCFNAVLVHHRIAIAASLRRRNRFSSCWSSSRAASCSTRSCPRESECAVWLSGCLVVWLSGCLVGCMLHLVAEHLFSDLAWWRAWLSGCLVVTCDGARCRFNEDTARFYFRQLVTGVKYCHNHGVCHRDLKPGKTRNTHKQPTIHPRHSCLVVWLSGCRELVA